MSGNDGSDGVVVAVHGRPSAGKTTFARAVEHELRREGTRTVVLDGDEVRASVTPRQGYSSPERESVYETLGNLAGLLARQGHVVIVPATAHRRVFRAHMRAVAPRFLEVHLDVSSEEAERRDRAKGLYERARSGSLSGTFPGLERSCEPPRKPDVSATGGQDTEAVAALVELVRATKSAHPPVSRIENIYVGFAVSSVRLLAEQEKICDLLGLQPRPELHVTLGYLGELPTDVSAALADALRAQLPWNATVPMRAEGVGIAKGDQGELVAWLAIHCDDRLRAARETTASILRHLGHDRYLGPTFFPHVTLGSRGPLLWDRHDVEKTATTRFELEVPVAALHITSVERHPASLVRLR